MMPGRSPLRQRCGCIRSVNSQNAACCVLRAACYLPWGSCRRQPKSLRINWERRLANQLAHALVATGRSGVHRRLSARLLRANGIRRCRNGRRRLHPSRLWRLGHGGRGAPRSNCWRLLRRMSRRGRRRVRAAREELRGRDGALAASAWRQFEPLASSELEVAAQVLRHGRARSAASRGAREGKTWDQKTDSLAQLRASALVCHGIRYTMGNKRSPRLGCALRVAP